MKNQIMMMLGQLLVLAILMTACGTSELEPASPVEITIEGQDILYSPDTLEAVAGRPVILTFKNAGALEHDINFDDLPIAEGQVVLTGTDSQSQAGEEMAKEGSEHEEGSDHEEGHEHDIPHDATLHVHTLSDQQLTVTFTPTESGTYEFYCTISGHREAGMVGTLVVAAP